MGDERTTLRVYAHFHRVLAELLLALEQDAEVTWLGEPGHRLTGDYSTNVYSPALYVTHSIDPYRAALSELSELQTEALELTGRSRPGRNLLPPLTEDNVTFIRISRYIGQTGRNITRDSALARLQQLEQTTVDNLQEFENYATRHDPARKQVESDLLAVRKARMAVENSRATALRETYRQTVVRPYVYRLNGSSEQLHMRSTGLIAAGPHVEVEWRQGPRRERSDKISIPPLAVAGPLQFFDLQEWEKAKQA